MDFTGPTSVFIQVPIDKKYALPYKVVDGLVFHFLRFKSVGDKLPVLWHKSLLAFAERYRNDITEGQRDALLDLRLVKGHPLMWPEIRPVDRRQSEGTGEGDDDAGRRPDDGVVVVTTLYRLVIGWGHKIK